MIYASEATEYYIASVGKVLRYFKLVMVDISVYLKIIIDDVLPYYNMLQSIFIRKEFGFLMI